MITQYYETVVAELRPLRTDDLKPEVIPYVGVVTTWRPLWTIEPEDSEEYAGMRAMAPADEGRWPFCWVPECDLRRVPEG